MRGFTTVRDCGGPAFGLKRAIDEGVVPGPRIYPVRRDDHADRRATATSGSRTRCPRDPCCGARAHRADRGRRRSPTAVSEVLRAVREQLMLGAIQIKLMAGGGVASPYDPLDVTQYTEAEMRAGGRGGRELGHLRHGACLHAARDPAGHPGRGALHRARPPPRRGDGRADRRAGHLVVPAALSRRRGRDPSLPARPRRSSWR